MAIYCRLFVVDIDTVVFHQRCSIKKAFLKIPPNSQKNTCAGFSFSIKLYASDLQLMKKKILKQVLSCEFRKIFKNTFFKEQFRWLLVLFSKRYSSVSSIYLEQKARRSPTLTLRAQENLLNYFLLFLSLRTTFKSFFWSFNIIVSWK